MTLSETAGEDSKDLTFDTKMQTKYVTCLILLRSKTETQSTEKVQMTVIERICS